MNTPPPLPKTPGTAVASLVLGISSFVCLGFLAGIPAVICGHIAQSKIKKTGAPGGGLAVAGLVLGYTSCVLTFFVLPILAAIAIPSVIVASDSARAAAMLNNARQIGVAMQSAGLVRVGNPPKPDVGYPADANIHSAAQIPGMLVEAGCLSENETARLGFDKFEFGNVAESDPADTILLRSKPDALKKNSVVLLKSGEGRIIRPGSSGSFGQDPPRSPSFLAP